MANVHDPGLISFKHSSSDFALHDHPEMDGPVEVFTDNKGAHDLCHRFSAAQHSRHIDRKMFKMRELRGAGVVDVRHIPGTENPADLFTKVLPPQVFHKHRKVVLNLHGEAGGSDADDVPKISKP